MDLSFVNNPIYSIAGFIIGVVGTIIGVVALYFYFKEKREKKPYYTSKTFTLIRNLSSTYEPLEISYSGQTIENLTVTKVAFWNAGEETINNTDIAGNEPLKIEMVDPHTILDFKVLYQKNDANGFSFDLSDDKKTINIGFDYVDKDQGFVLQILHTGVTRFFRFKGKIKGYGKVTRINLGPTNYSIYEVIMLCLFIPGFFLIFLNLIILAIVCGVISTGTLIWTIYRENVLKPDLPKEFKDSFK